MAGKSDQAKGRVKKAVGDLTGNKQMQREGRMQETKGQMLGKIENAKDKVVTKIDKVSDKVQEKVASRKA